MGTGLTDPDDDTFSLQIWKDSNSNLLIPYEIVSSTPTSLKFKVVTDNT